MINISVRVLLLVLCQMPLCICLAGSALLIQWADFMRGQAVTDDTLLPALSQFIHPAALAFLIAGYVLSLAICAVSVYFALRRNAPDERLPG
ncbi:MAG: hypothetical protein IJ109_09230 [Firmicutes bacterium]|nr:hypothetical protein [Bacillota bacterium]